MTYAHPQNDTLLAALQAHRHVPDDQALRNALGVLLHQALSQLATHRVNTPKMRPLIAHREDELVERAWQRLDNKAAKNAQLLLANYDLTQGTQVIAYLAKMVDDIARNMLDEAYVPDGGFHTPTLLAELRRDGQLLRSHTRIETQLAADIDVVEEQGQIHVPIGQWVSETPLRETAIRVNNLTHRLTFVCKGMAGESLGDTTISPQQAWLFRAWLGLEGEQYLDLSEQELSDALLGSPGGTSKPQITRASSLGFNYLLQHPQWSQILNLLVPSNVSTRSGVADPGHERSMALMDAHLRGAGGKNALRTLVHAWLKSA